MNDLKQTDVNSLVESGRHWDFPTIMICMTVTVLHQSSIFMTNVVDPESGLTVIINFLQDNTKYIYIL